MPGRKGHRIQQESQLDALHDARDNGADCVKQWDATLDSRTRPDHQAADGQLRELDEDFNVGGERMKAPGVGGSARNVCNCRCCMLQRARWALDEEELKTLKDRAKYFGLDKTKDFEEFKDKYLKAVEIKTDSGIIRLSGSEMYAVNQYVGFQSYVINEKLRTVGETALSDSEKKIVSDLDKALEKFPTYTGTVTRSLQFGDSDAVEEFVSQFEIGKSYSTAQYFSTTKSDELYNPEGEVQIFIMESKSGRDISSVNKDELEVLYGRNEKFITLNKTEQNGEWYIILEEDK
ncbi:MAG: hypothetical protein LIO86_15335 [Lachnospiraceae bacterium]|nr:hypothetical protein [Lachnospiraceae bacterium]